MKEKNIIIALIAVALFFVVRALPHAPQGNNPANPANSFPVAVQGKVFSAKEEHDRWDARIDAVGPERAYEEFKTAYANENFGIQHSAAHIMGALLYEKLGVPGLTICDATFAFGCYHSFFGQALAEHGLTIIRDFDATCIKKFGPLGTGCQHGIGHGILEYVGHTNLLNALNDCLLTNQVNPLFGCTSGVFMEYNVPIIISGDAPASTDPRVLDNAHPYAPCPSLPLTFQNSCYYEMAQLWDKAYQGNFKKIGELCNGIPSAALQESCYLGTGNVAAPSSQYDVKATIEKCELMPTAQGRLLCRSGASWSFFAAPQYRVHAPELCADLSLSFRTQCAKASDLIGNGEILQTPSQ